MGGRRQSCPGIISAVKVEGPSLLCHSPSSKNLLSWRGAGNARMCQSENQGHARRQFEQRSLLHVCTHSYEGKLVALGSWHVRNKSGTSLCLFCCCRQRKAWIRLHGQL